VELYNYDLRKNVFQYDEVLSLQREKIFEARKEIIFKNISPDFFFRLAEISFDDIYLDNSLNNLENYEKSPKEQNPNLVIAKFPNSKYPYKEFIIKDSKIIPRTSLSSKPPTSFDR
jgi:preprotein translocase subunit SecA